MASVSRIALIGFNLESNRWAPVVGRAAFEADLYLRGDEILGTAYLAADFPLMERILRYVAVLGDMKGVAMKVGQLVVATVVMAYYSWQLTLLTIASFVPATIVVGTFSKACRTENLSSFSKCG